MLKNKKQNAFYLFMLDYKRQEEKKGRKFPKGLKDVQSDAKCNEIWKNLSNEDKSYYKLKEKNNQIEYQNERKTAVGEFLNKVQEEELLKKQFFKNMKEDILLTLKQANKSNSIQQLKFYVIHVNFFYTRIIDNEVEYCPAEIAIAEFSLEKGVTRTYHKIINSEIQLGYTSAATEYSRDTHQIPKNPSFGERDYGVICKEIYEFLKPEEKNGKLPPLYTRFKIADIKYPVIYILDTLAKRSNNFIHKFTVHSFEELFVSLRNINIKDCSNIIVFDEAITSLKLQEDPFNYIKSLQCDFHQRTGGGNYCSQSHIQRWIFVMYSYVCPLFEIYLTIGVHVPIENSNTEGNTSLEIDFKKVNLHKSKTFNQRTTITTTQIFNKNSEACERTYFDKERCKPESLANPLKISYHNSTNQEFSTKQLSSPPTKSHVSKWHIEESVGLNFDENNFPIGRGSRIKERASEKYENTDFASRLK